MLKRYLRGQRVSTAVVKSTVNRIIGQIRWSRRGVHRSRQVRLTVLRQALAATSPMLAPAV